MNEFRINIKTIQKSITRSRNKTVELPLETVKAFLDLVELAREWLTSSQVTARQARKEMIHLLHTKFDK